MQPIQINKKRSIIDSYMVIKTENPQSTCKQIMREVAEKIGVGISSVQRILSEYNKTKTLKSPVMKKVRSKLLDSINEFDRTAIRQKVYSFWFNREFPTLNKIVSAAVDDENLPTLKRSSMYILLKELQFVITRKKTIGGVLMDTEDLICERRRYLREIRKYRDEGRTVYYLDEMSTNVGPNITFVHIASNKGFVDGALWCFESKTNSADYRYELDGDQFSKWFKFILSLLKCNSVLVMDNAPYHCAKLEQIPTSSWMKSDIVTWLRSKNIQVDPELHAKVELLKLVASCKNHYDKYMVDEIARTENKIVLRLPPYHGTLNPVELAWSTIKADLRSENIRFVHLDEAKQHVIDILNRLTVENWSNYERQILDEEKKFWDIDDIMDEMIENNLAIKTNNSSSSDSENDLISI